MKKAIPILLIIIGIGFILTPSIKEQVVKHYTNSIKIEDIDSEIIKSNNENTKLIAEFNFSAVEDIDIKSIIKGSINFNKDFMIGTILVPELDINIPIMKGLSDANLMAGAATMKPEQAFGSGNFTLAGHNMKNKDLLFGSLMDIEVGDVVYLSNGEKIYEYHIYDTVIVPDTALEMLSDEKADEKGKPIVSLMTCYFSSKTGKRFFALGELVDEYPIE